MFRQTPRFVTSGTLSFWVLSILLIALWIAGGASRADALGQVLVRFVAWLALIVMVVLGYRINWARIRVPAIILALAIALVALQLLPLPPAMWTALPGRSLIESAAVVMREPQPWRPLSLSPGATANALGSLVVPVAVLAAVAGLTSRDEARVLRLLLALVFASGLIGLLQFSGAQVDNPFINDIRGEVSGSFANRNHLALFLAVGCAIALPVLMSGRPAAWKAAAGLGTTLFLALMIIATGSRAGLVLGAVAMGLGFAMSFARLKDDLKRISGKLTPFVFGGIALTFVASVWLLFVRDRAASIDRVMSLDAGEDLRGRSHSVVANTIAEYFPFGSGFGTFDPVYRIMEPDALLSPNYFNHAHNDFAEIVLDGGLPGAALLLVGIGWAAWRGLRIWRSRGGQSAARPRIGFAIMVLILAASIPDYPARTPIFMALIALSAAWISPVPARPVETDAHRVRA